MDEKKRYLKDPPQIALTQIYTYKDVDFLITLPNPTRSTNKKFTYLYFSKTDPNSYYQVLIKPEDSMQFCLEVWGTDYEKIKDTCVLAEKLGYYGFYYGESLAEIDLDCWSVISNLSAMTTRIKLRISYKGLENTTMPELSNSFWLSKILLNTMLFSYL